MVEQVMTADGTKILPGKDGEYGGRKRQGQIESLNWDNDHEVVYVMISWAGGCQGFGGLVLDMRQTIRFLLAVFFSIGADPYGGKPGDLSLLEEAWHGDLVARRKVDERLRERRLTCLWCLGGNQTMEGIEGPGGRLTLTGFRRALGFTDAGPLAQSEEALSSEIIWATRRIEEALKRLRELRTRHWDPGDGTVTGF